MYPSVAPIRIIRQLERDCQITSEVATNCLLAAYAVFRIKHENVNANVEVHENEVHENEVHENEDGSEIDNEVEGDSYSEKHVINAADVHPCEIPKVVFLNIPYHSDMKEILFTHQYTITDTGIKIVWDNKDIYIFTDMQIASDPVIGFSFSQKHTDLFAIYAIMEDSNLGIYLDETLKPFKWSEYSGILSIMKDRSKEKFMEAAATRLAFIDCICMSSYGLHPKSEIYVNSRHVETRK
jgi:hypothetical protein